MPHHYILHKLHVHPRFHHTKKHLSHVRKTHPKSHGGALVHRRQTHQIHHAHPDTGFYSPGFVSHGSGVHHRKKLHPLKFKI